MTPRTRLAVVTAAGTVAVGLAIRPLLPAGHPAGPAPAVSAPQPPTADESAATATAIRAAGRALACPPTIPTPTPAPTPNSRAAATGSADPLARAGWCGPYTVSREQTVCAAAGSPCRVQLVGALDTPNTGTPNTGTPTAGTPATGTVVVALIVTVAWWDGAWHAIEVRS